MVISAFVAGLFTFLAPCTLPLVPGYLGFLSGAAAGSRHKVFFHGLAYVLGFSTVFVLLGSLFGLGGAAFAQYRVLLSRLGGFFVIIFGLTMLKVVRLPGFDFLNADWHAKLPRFVKPGHLRSSFLFGAVFAFGWTPCVGPLLGSILLLASSTANVGQGAFLLSIFSLGLAVPFLVLALTLGSAAAYVRKINRLTGILSAVGGFFLVFVGALLLFDKMGIWVGFFYRLFSFINYESLLKFL